jgi:hypothetical protein
MIFSYCQGNAGNHPARILPFSFLGIHPLMDSTVWYGLIQSLSPLTSSFLNSEVVHLLSDQYNVTNRPHIIRILDRFLDKP